MFILFGKTGKQQVAWTLCLDGTQDLELSAAASTDVAEDRQLLVVLAATAVTSSGSWMRK